MENIHKMQGFFPSFLQNYYFLGNSLAIFFILMYNQSIIYCRKAEKEK